MSVCEVSGEELARAVRDVANAVTPLSAAAGHDDYGNSIASLTEAVMSVSSALSAIASAIQSVADAVEQSQ